VLVAFVAPPIPPADELPPIDVLLSPPPPCAEPPDPPTPTATDCWQTPDVQSHIVVVQPVLLETEVDAELESVVPGELAPPPVKLEDESLPAPQPSATQAKPKRKDVRRIYRM
jgi:hypothetical protein